MHHRDISMNKLEIIKVGDMEADVVIADNFCLDRGFMVSIWLTKNQVQNVRFQEYGDAVLTTEIQELRTRTRRSRQSYLYNGVLNSSPMQFVSLDYARRYEINNVIISPMITPDGRYLGNMVTARRDKPFTTNDVASAQMLAQVSSVFLSYYQDAQMVVRQMLVNQLASGVCCNDSLNEAAVIANFYPAEPHILLLLQPRDWDECRNAFIEACRQSLSEHSDLIWTITKDGLLVLLPIPDKVSPERGRSVHSLHTRLGEVTNTRIRDILQKVGFSSLYGGISGKVSTTEAYQGAYTEAVSAARLAKIAQVPLIYSENSLLPLNLLNLQDINAAEAFVSTVLGPVLRHKNGDVFLNTLREFVRNDRQLKSTAIALHIHFNTLCNHLREIETLLQSDLRQSETFFQIQMALTLIDLFTPGRMGFGGKGSSQVTTR